MTALGDFLERFYGPEEFFRTVQARVRHTQRNSSEDSSVGRQLRIGRQRRHAMPPNELTTDLLFWGELPDKVRVETTRVTEGRTETTVEVVNGETMWERHADGTVEKGNAPRVRRSETRDLPTEFQRHFDRGLLRQCFAALTLEPISTCRIAGYDCLTIRARKIPGARLWPHWLSFEATEFEFAANVEHAVLLSIKSLVDRALVENHEVQEVKFDEKIDETIFVYEAKGDEKIQAATPVAERISLEAAIARAPIVVLQPDYTPNPEQTRVNVMYHPKRPGGEAESLKIFYYAIDTPYSLWIEQRGTPEESLHQDFEWEEILVESQRIEISDPYPEKGLRILSCQHEETFVTITSNLPRDELIKIALSLTPARKQDHLD